MIISVHQPQYIPWLGYIDKIAKSDCFVFLDAVQYKEREFQNRNKVRTKDGWIWLSVPVISKGLGRQRILEVGVDNERDWARQHLKSLEVCYGKAKYFGRYFDFFKEAYAARWEKLCKLNVHIVKFILNEFALSPEIYFESELNIHSTRTDRIIDICARLKADTYLSGAGGREYLEEEKFKAAGIRLVYQDFTHPVYHQQFASGEKSFIPCMSAIDLLFNEGPKSVDILGLGK